MFCAPDAKRVRRSELYPSASQVSSPAPLDAELDSVLRKKLKEAYGDMDVFGPDSVTGFNYTSSTCTDNNGRKTASSRPLCISDGTGMNGSSEACLPPDRKEDVSEEDKGDVDAENSGDSMAGNIPEVAACFEFRLFNSSSASKVHGTSTQSPPPRVFLDSDADSAGDDDGSFLNPRRPASCYFAAAATGTKKREFEEAAVTGEAVRLWQRVRYTGWEVPWRVKTVVVPPASANDRRGWAKKALGGPVETVPARDGGGADGRKTRKKPGKKRRIVLRTRRRAAEEAREKKRREDAEKEVRMREKRTRMNREKKVKRKQKEKAKKGETAATVSATQAPDNRGDSGEKGDNEGRKG